MAVPPPTSGNDETTVAFGIASVDGVLEEAAVDFPAEGEELIVMIGDREVPADPSGTTVTLATVIEATDQAHFESRQELLDALHPEFEKRRTAGGLARHLRSLLPF
ncbi:MAG: hypothetical protein ACOCY6_00025 [Halodesulfurarchaeum sp.]